MNNGNVMDHGGDDLRAACFCLFIAFGGEGGRGKMIDVETVVGAGKILLLMDSVASVGSGLFVIF